MLCFSPSVLDRLNALLEPGGVLTIDERGVIDGQIPSIKPHPNFRFSYLNYATRAVARKTLLVRQCPWLNSLLKYLAGFTSPLLKEK